MVLKSELPTLSDLSHIACSVDSYPTSTEKIAKCAKKLGHKQSVIDFINLFNDTHRDVFDTRVDFYTRSAELILLIHEEYEQPKEALLNAQS